MADQVLACHILIKWQGSRRKHSWRPGSEGRIGATTRQHAEEQMNAWRQLILDGVYTFEQVAQLISDCSSARYEGSLGWFGRGEMQPQFEFVAFSLEVGQISEPFFSDSGIHIVKRLQ